MKNQTIRRTTLSILVGGLAVTAIAVSDPSLDTLGVGSFSSAGESTPSSGDSLAPPGLPENGPALGGRSEVIAGDSPTPPGAFDSRPAPDNRSDIIPGRYIVVFEDSVKNPGSLARAQVKQRGGKLGFVYRHALNGYSTGLSEGAAEALRSDPRVKRVSPVREATVQFQETPTGIERIYATQNEVAEIDGEDERVDVDVAVIDSGIDYDHPDLNVVGRTDCVPTGEDTEEEFEECVGEAGDDGHGHGSHVAGTIGALDDDEGVVGVAPGARLWAVRVLNNAGSGSFEWIIGAIDWVTATREDEDPENDIEVANMSIGCTSGLPCVVPELDEAFTKSVNAGVIYAVAAGNASGDVSDEQTESTFGTNPHVITVSALADYDGKPGGESAPTCNNYDSDDDLASFSNYGKDVEVAAPGTCIYSTSKNGSYATKSGTSMASPHVAGAAALRASQDPPEDLEDVEAIREAIEADGNLEWSDDSPDEVQEPLLDVGRAVTEPAAIESESKVTLRGRVRPVGSETSYRFEYGETDEYGASVPVPDEKIEPGSGYVALSEPLEGLEGQTTYHYRIVATYGEETIYGGDRTFGTTPPIAVTGEASDVHGNDAVLNATVNPEGVETTYWFEYGPTSEYGFKAPATAKYAGLGTEAIAVSEPVGGLIAEETYHFRIVAQNAAGTVSGSDEALETEPPDWIAHLPTAVDVEEVTGLPAISCIAENDCVLLGVPYSADRALAWRLHDEEWFALPDIPGAEGADFTHLRDVSCTSASWCVAGGYTNTDGNWQPIIATWDGSEWQLTEVSLPPTATRGRIEKVSCTSTTFCMAVGRSFNGFPTKSLAWRWDGEGWSAETVPSIAASAHLLSVSCTSSSHCVAGGYEVGLGWKVFVVSWDGSEWSVDRSYFPYGSETALALDVSCSSADACTVAGAYNDGYFADRWSGGKWSLGAISPFPAGHQSGYIPLAAYLSCPSDTFCALVAPLSNSGTPARSWAPSYAWDGDSWTAQSTGTPVLNEEHASASWVYDAECTSPSTCIAAGGANFPGSESVRGMITVNTPPVAPTATTEVASELTQTTATLNGTVNPKNADSTYQFEYVDQAEYEANGYENATAVPSSPKDVESGIWKVAVSEAIAGLELSTTYHFRVVASNEQGAVSGGDETFTTAVPPYFDAESHPVTIAGSQSETEPLKLETVAGTVVCAVAELEGQASAPSQGQDLDAEFSNCKLASTFTTTVTMNSCRFELGVLNAGPPYEGDLGIACEEEGDEIVVEVHKKESEEVGCTITYAPQQGGEEGVSLKNFGEGPDRGIEADFEGVPLTGKYTGGVLNCGAPNGWKSNVPLSGTFALGGFDGEEAVGVSVSTAPFIPRATTGEASAVGLESATLNAEVNPEGLETTYQFEYVAKAEFEESGYESATTVPTSPKEVGLGTSDVAVDETPEGLEPATTYHFRVFATNEAGTAYGEDAEFTTAARSLSEQLAEMLVTEPFYGPGRYERFESLWFKPGWAANKGQGPAYAWGTHSTPPDLSGVYYHPALSDEGWGLAAAATLRAAHPSCGCPPLPGNEFSLWLDMPDPSEAERAGYELRFTRVSAKDTYDVALSKWVGGEETELAAKASYSFAEGSSLALVDQGATLSAWTDTGSGFEQLLDAADSTFAGGKAGLSGTGSNVRLKDFKATALAPPEAATEAATEIGQSTATLNGTVNPEGLATEYRFQWASDAEFEAEGYAHETSATEAGSGTEYVAASDGLEGLEPGVTYHFRAVAESEAGTVWGKDSTFKTEAE